MRLGNRLWPLYLLVVGGPTSTTSHAQEALALEHRLCGSRVLERVPLVAQLTVRNVGNRVVKTIFPEESSDILADRASLVLESSDGRRLWLRYRGGPLGEETAPVACFSIEPGHTRTAERLCTLIVRTPPPPGWAGSVGERYEFVGPGVYKAHFEVALLQGEKLESEDSELTILEAEGIDKEVRDLIHFRHVGILEGREPGAPEYFARGGKTRHGVDVSQFRELQDILEKHPDSTYAEWIRFWKLYHHGPVEDAIKYAREHREFPLSDNLLLHVAERLFHRATKWDRATYNRVRELVGELLRDFPEGDTRAQTLSLQEKLSRKP